MIESCHELSLELMSFDVAPQRDLYTKQGVAVTVEAVAQIKVVKRGGETWIEGLKLVGGFAGENSRGR